MGSKNMHAWERSILDKIRPQDTILVVIDIQNDFCSPDGALALLGSDVSPSSAVARRIAEAIPEFRPLVAGIVFFKLVHDPERMGLAQKERLLRDGRPVVCSPESNGTEFFEVEPEPSDFIFIKHRYSAFTNPDFVQLLKDRKIQNILVSGVDTHICVEGTIRQGYDLGYRMIALKDLIATRSSEVSRHDSTIALVERYFGFVAESHELLTVLNRREFRANQR